MGAQKNPLSPATFRFFRELSRHNRKQWMDANRARYQECVVRPLRALLETLTPAALQLCPDFEVAGRTGVNFSRINRDIRFAKDKTPYRAQMYLFFPGPGGKGWQGGQLYVGVAADIVTAGFRVYSEGGKHSPLTRRVLPRVRKKPQWLAQQKRRLGAKCESYWYSMERGQWTKHDGWPFSPDDWMRLRGWVVRRTMQPSSAVRAAFPGAIVRIFRDIFPLFQFTSLPG